MKRRAFGLLIMGFISISVFAQSQHDLNNEADEQYQASQKMLDNTYAQILHDFKVDTIFIANLKNAQTLWIKFRDSEMHAKYPNRENGYYGSVQTMCWSLYKAALTSDRIKNLKKWIEGTVEGDVCSGTVPFKK